jgi:acyl-CoA synthetase (AMP-forming)/AMP-acid ligase II
MHFNLADLFEAVADAVPERTALVCGAHRLTYVQLEQRANRLANYLASTGLGAGDHVGLYLYNCNAYIEVMLACFKLRAVPVNINYRYVSEELLYIIQNADLKACIHHREFIPTLEAVRNETSDLQTLLSVEDGSAAVLSSIGAKDYESSIAHASILRDFPERTDDDLFLLYTGGTTGMPKGVMWPHKALFYAAMGGGGFFHANGAILEPEEITSRIGEQPITTMALAPLMHGASWWSACIQLLAGNSLILNPYKSLLGEQVWDIVEQEKVNMLTIVGDAIAIPLLDALDANPGRWNLSSIFGITSGGAVFSSSKQADFRRHFPAVMISNAFGSSESGSMGADSGERRAGDEGLGRVSKSEFMSVVVTEEEPPRHALSGETGIFARAGHIPLGYYNDPLKTVETFIQVAGERWLLTGDRARLDDDESITIFGRGSNCINSGGEKIFPEEVEDALKAHEGVYDALVVGMPDERWGNRVVAVVQFRAGVALNLEDVQAHCREHIAAYKVPRELHCVAEIPRAPSGKPDYPATKKLVTSGEFAASGALQ